MAVIMIPSSGACAARSARDERYVDDRAAFLAPSGVFALRRFTVGVLLGLLLVIVGFAARPHLVAPDVRPASSVGSNQINVDTDGAASQLLRVNDATGDGALPVEAAAVAAGVASSDSGSTDGGSAGTGSVYVVQDGDSLWSIAAARVSADQLDGYLGQLIALNGSGTLLAGQQLILPN